jgi:pimeloyl-ACP methyl ester carboxylesterase
MCARHTIETTKEVELTKMAMPLDGAPGVIHINPEVAGNPYASEGFLVPEDILMPGLASVTVLPHAIEHFENLNLEVERRTVPTIVHPPAIAEIGGTKTSFTVEEPAMLDDLVSESSIIISHGIFGEEVIYEDLRHELAALGWRVITCSPGDSNGLRGYHPDHLLHPEKLLAQVVKGVMREASKQHDYERYIVAGHSMAGLTIHGLLDHLGDDAPKWLDAIIYIDAVGFNEDPLVMRARRFLQMLRTQAAPYVIHQRPRKLARIARSEAHYLGRGLGRIGREVLAAQACANGDSVLHARELNIRTGGIALKRSGIFPAEAVSEESADLFDVFEIYDADHLGPNNDPKGMAKLLHGMLGELLEPFAGVN